MILDLAAAAAVGGGDATATSSNRYNLFLLAATNDAYCHHLHLRLIVVSSYCDYQESSHDEAPSVAPRCTRTFSPCLRTLYCSFLFCLLQTRKKEKQATTRKKGEKKETQ